MPEEPNNGTGQTPPYVAYKTFKNAVRGLQHEGRLPDRIDSSALMALSGSTRKMFLLSLRWLNLIDKDGIPSPLMGKLAAANEAEWKSLIGEAVKSHYATQVPILKSGTPKQLRESFADVPASCVVPAMRFLIHAAEDAGLPVSHVIDKNRGGSVSGASSGKGKRRRREEGADMDDTINPAVDPPAPSKADSFKMALLDKFPAFNPEWGEEQQKNWFSAYQRLLDLQSGETLKH